MKLRQSTSQLAHTTTEFQQYKQRANTLLQQMSPDDNEDTSRTAMLESELSQLKLERTELVNVSSTSAKRIKVLEQDLRQTLETVEQLQKEKKNAGKLEKQCDQLRRELSELRQAKIDEKTRFEKELEDLQAQCVNLQAVKSEPDHIPEHANDIDGEKKEESDQLKATITNLNDEITCLKAEVKSLEGALKEIQKAPVFESQDSIEMDPNTTDQRSVGPLSPNPTHTSSPTTGSVYASLSNLLSPTQLFGGSETSGGVSPAGEQIPSNNSSLMKEKEYQQQLKYLAEMLNDSENVVMTLRAQEKVCVILDFSSLYHLKLIPRIFCQTLKEEIR
ncbi:hypothetical protein K450DRAFT_260730 [Umbelopsis ramanniana AG]|uniref:Uncharacterized protein n=1 Tax=Umbelopsis ramanniana AG TaxID=1314678 RepID=A0AAD5E3H0_UMBRA|nr:uncharacterized protein K450DRAFT_260730 [Umbelopsis ramanniana AG]KAI8575690.1 hypothetical protein K450DRAFT_260730 [Umbelopsis ramanniana AG]